MRWDLAPRPWGESRSPQGHERPTVDPREFESDLAASSGPDLEVERDRGAEGVQRAERVLSLEEVGPRELRVPRRCRGGVQPEASALRGSKRPMVRRWAADFSGGQEGHLAKGRAGRLKVEGEERVAR